MQSFTLNTTQTSASTTLTISVLTPVLQEQPRLTEKALSPTTGHAEG